MNSSLVDEGGRIAREDVIHRAPEFWREPLFGLIPMPLLLNFVAVLLVALIFWWLLRGSHKGVETPLNLLKRRYVVGEIDRKTFLQMKEDITE